MHSCANTKGVETQTATALGAATGETLPVQRRNGVILACFLVLVGCASTSTAAPTVAPAPAQVQVDAPPRVRGDSSINADIGASGGSLELTNGFRVQVPQGALDATVNLTLSAVPVSAAIQHATEVEPVSPAVALQPGATLASGKVVTVSFPAPSNAADRRADLALAVETPAENQRGYDGYNTQTRWQMLPVRIEGNRLAADIDAIPGLRIQFVYSP